jgi:hypothetical protein
MQITTTLRAKVGRKSFQVESWQQVSEAYRAMLDTLEEDGTTHGASDAPPCIILDNKGNVVARVSYNGKVWAGADWKDGDQPLFNPYK